MGDRFAQYVRPGWRRRPTLALAASVAGSNGVDQIAHGIDFGQLRLRHFAAELLLNRGQQFDTLHGVESEIEFEIMGGANRVGSIACEFPRRLPYYCQCALYIFLLQ